LARRYSETGEFIDTRTRLLFEDRFRDWGTAKAPIVLGGLRFAGDRVSVGYRFGR